MKYFLIKADDFRINHLTRSWKYFLKINNELGIPINLGLICNSLLKTSILYKKETTGYDLHEFFIHGYDHLPDEFTGTTKDEQIKIIYKIKELVNKEFGVEISSFGAPFNKYNADTVKALEKTKIKTWFFGDDFNGLNLSERNFEFEYSNSNNGIKNRYLRIMVTRGILPLKFKNHGNCNTHELIIRYNDVIDLPLIIGQIHPKRWSKYDLTDYRNFVEYVLEKGEHSFVTAKEYYNLASG